MQKRCFFAVSALSFLFISSCALLDFPARVAGYSIQKFENETNGRYDEFFNMSKSDCFNKTLEILSGFKARVTHKSYKKGYVAAFDFTKNFDYCLDSTEAAVFIKEEEGETVKVSVISNNSLLAKNLADEFFKALRIQKPPEKNHGEN
jgi:hypothetical protein